MTGHNDSEKSRLSTSIKRPSRRTNNSATYQQLERRNLLATFVVNTVDDIVADDGLVSLREAITAANTNMPFSDVGAGEAEGDRIVFSQAVRERTFVLDAELEILDDLVIRGYQSPEGFDTALESSISGNRLINIDTPERVYLRDLDLAFGRADEGALVKVNNGGNVVFESSFLQNGSAQQGGAVFATDSRLVFVDTRIANNNAADSGGGIWSEGGEIILLRQSDFSSNVATAGGGIYADNGTRLFVAESDFSTNFSSEFGGGAIWAGNETSVQVIDSRFEFNGARPSDSNSASVDLLKGGAVAAFGDSLRIVDSSFFANNAGEGGALFSQASNATLVDTIFDQNRANVRGGAAWFSGEEVRFNGGTVTGNAVLDGLGGGLEFASPSIANQLVAVIRDVDILSNSATSGAGIRAANTDLRILHSTISDNLASLRGGGLAMVHSNLYVLDTVFSTNGVEGFGDGGAITSFNSTSFIDGSTFRNNNARAGAGVTLRNVEDMTLRNTVFEANRADSGGGAVFVNGHSTLRSFGSTFNSNTAGSGGAVFVVNTGRFVSRSTTFVSNMANGEGGAILTGGTVNIASTTFEGNRATRGGAIKVGGESGLLSISGSTVFNGNVASRNGAAISSTTSSISLIDDVEFNANVAESDFGELLFIGDVAFHRVTNSTIT